MRHLKDITNLSNEAIAWQMKIPRETVRNILHQTTGAVIGNRASMAKGEKTGRPKKYTEEQINFMIQHATKNRENRHKTFTDLARDMTFPIDRQVSARLLAEKGYKLYVAEKKPELSQQNRDARLKFAIEHKDEPIDGHFDGWLFSNEMYYVLGPTERVIHVVRKSDERWHPDCVEYAQPEQVRIMFWEVIAYNVPCSECSLFLWEEETPEEQAEIIAMLERENEELEKSLDINPNWY